MFWGCISFEKFFFFFVLKVRMSVEQSSSETGVPLRCFYGDPSRKLYDALGELVFFPRWIALRSLICF